MTKNKGCQVLYIVHERSLLACSHPWDKVLAYDNYGLCPCDCTTLEKAEDGGYDPKI